MSLAHQYEIEGPPEPRLCGRCRGSFAGDEALPMGLDTGWWACPPCAELLLGRGALAKPTWPARARR